ncbi:hypothetical protein [Streptomyces vinaceus]|uniref:hypothetical protein n=1 Tax=Streptomyces vinaceus TaxID=1960 RepID=UPI003694028F
MLTVHSPEPGFSGEVGGVIFAGGAATVDPQAPNTRAALAYFRRSGYRVVDDAPTEASSPADPAPAADFDPSEHTVDDVLAYLADADEAERARVLAVEEAGQARVTILKKGQPSE